MSRGFFDTDVVLDEGDRYRAAEPAGRGLTNEILESYLSTEVIDHEHPFDLDEGLIEKIHEEWKGTGQELLDSILMGLRKSDKDHLKHSPQLINALVNEFYNSGENGFLLDYRSLPATFIQHSGKGLEGSVEDPLRIRYLLDEKDGISGGSIGEDSRHCIFDIHGGVFNIAEKSEHCTFISEELPSYMGIDAQHCEIYLRDGEEFNCERIGDFFVHIRHKAERKRCDLLAEYFERGNRIYLGEGGRWEEYIPAPFEEQ